VCDGFCCFVENISTGISEILSVAVEGESLLNDGVAIMLFEILVECVEEPEQPRLALKVLEKFCQIALGGFAFGFVMGKITIFVLSRIDNDAIGESAMTLVSAYLTYYIADAILGTNVEFRQRVQCSIPALGKIFLCLFVVRDG
jgi:sodium/hydrogen exchanger 10/11